jgi:hypothetical protein
VPAVENTWGRGVSGNHEKIVAEIIANALSAAKPGGAYLMPAGQHRARARRLRQTNSNSRAAELHELAARAIERRLRERASDRDARGENSVAGMSSNPNPKVANDGPISHASATIEPTRFWSDDKLILAAILLVTVCWPLWPLVVLWTAIQVGFRGVENFGDWWRKRQQQLYATPRQ